MGAGGEDHPHSSTSIPAFICHRSLSPWPHLCIPRGIPSGEHSGVLHCSQTGLQRTDQMGISARNPPLHAQVKSGGSGEVSSVWGSRVGEGGCDFSWSCLCKSPLLVRKRGLSGYGWLNLLQTWCKAVV